MALEQALSTRSLRICSALAVCVAMAACGGGGGGSPAAPTPAPAPSPTPTPPPPPVNLAPTAIISSVANGQLLSAPVTITAQSTDPEGDALTHTWTLTSRPTGSAASLSSTSGGSITLTPDVAGSYTVSLVSSDGTNTSAAATRTFTAVAANLAPTAAIGAVPTGLRAGQTVTLTANSTDPEGEPLTNTWTLVTAPAGNALSSPTGNTVTLVPTAAGSYTVRLVASDGVNNSAPVTTTFSIAVNAAPTAAISSVAAVVPAGQAVNLTAQSTDADDATLTNTWAITTAPAGSTATLSSTSGNSVSLTPVVSGSYTVTLTSSDGFNTSTATRTFAANVAPTASLAYAGTPPATIRVGELVSLQATVTDPDSTPTLTWQITPPAGSTVTTVTASGATATFRPDVVGSYSVRVTANDAVNAAVQSTALTASVVAQPGEVACTSSTETAAVFRFRQPTNSSVSVAATGAGNIDGNSACFHRTTLQNIRGYDSLSPGGFYYFEATRFGPAHIGVASAAAPDSPEIGYLEWPANTASYVLSPCLGTTDVNAAGCKLQGYGTGDTSTIGFAVDYRNTFPVVYVIGPPTDRGDLPEGCRVEGTGALQSSCVIERRTLNVSGPVQIYAYGNTAGGVTGRVTINGGEASAYAYDTTAMRAALRRNWYEGDRQLVPQWPSTASPASMPTVPTIARTGATPTTTLQTVIRSGDAAPYRASLGVTTTGTGATVTWRNAAGTQIGTGTTLTLSTAGTPILPVGEHRIEAVATIGRMTAAVPFVVRIAPAAPGAPAPDTTDEDWDGDGLNYVQETAAGTDPGNPDTDRDGIADAVDGTPIAGTPVTPVTLVRNDVGTTAQGLVLSDDGLNAVFTSELNPSCLATAGNSVDFCSKRGIRASAGVAQGTFRYYEVRKRVPNPSPTQGPNMGAGVIIASTDMLDPYRYTSATSTPDPRTPASMSANFAASLWNRLAALPSDSPSGSWDGANSEYVGFAIDYRTAGEVTVWVVFTRDPADPAPPAPPTPPVVVVSNPITVTGFTGNAMPFVFGHPQSDVAIAEEVNFGLKQFHYDSGTRNLRAALTAAGVPGVGALQPGIGVHARPLAP